MKIYTKTGDKGDTSLLGGKRVNKNCVEMHAIGEVDELNAVLGILLSFFLERNEMGQTIRELTRVQHRLFTVGSNLAALQTDLVQVPKLVEEDVRTLEQWIDCMQEDLEPLRHFILPGGDRLAAYCFFARALCRRAEREIVGLWDEQNNMDPLLLQYINRLSDVLFVLGRWVNRKQNVEDVEWKK